jgi:hypothetical protein
MGGQVTVPQRRKRWQCFIRWRLLARFMPFRPGHLPNQNTSHLTTTLDSPTVAASAGSLCRIHQPASQLATSLIRQLSNGTHQTQVRTIRYIGSCDIKRNGRPCQTRPRVDVLPCLPSSMAKGQRGHRMPCMHERIHRNCTTALARAYAD